jgi:hypothetical protein
MHPLLTTNSCCRSAFLRGLPKLWFALRYDGAVEQQLFCCPAFVPICLERPSPDYRERSEAHGLLHLRVVGCGGIGVGCSTRCLEQTRFAHIHHQRHPGYRSQLRNPSKRPLHRKTPTRLSHSYNIEKAENGTLPRCGTSRLKGGCGETSLLRTGFRSWMASK